MRKGREKVRRSGRKGKIGENTERGWWAIEEYTNKLEKGMGVEVKIGGRLVIK